MANRREGELKEKFESTRQLPITVLGTLGGETQGDVAEHEMPITTVVSNLLEHQDHHHFSPINVPNNRTGDSLR